MCDHAADVASFGRAVLGVTQLVSGAVAYNEIDLRSGSATAGRACRLIALIPLIDLGSPAKISDGRALR